MAVRLSGNALVSINIVALRWARLVLGWVTVRGHTISVFNFSHPGLLSLTIPPWIGAMSSLLSMVLATDREETASSV